MILSHAESLRLLTNKLQFKVMDEAKCKSPWLMSPLRDLVSHESIGHTCAKHIGLSVVSLRHRLTTERIAEASCFWSIDAATATVCYLTMDNLGKIIGWAQTADGRVTIEGQVPTLSSIGYIVGRTGLSKSNRARMVLQRLSSNEIFGIVTAFPIR